LVLAGDTEPFPDDRAGGEQAACRRRRGRGRPRCAEPLARRRCVAPLCTGVARSRTPGSSPAGARRVVRPAACITGLRGGAAVAEVGVEPAASGTRRECGDDGPQAAADPVDVDQAGLAVARCRAREQCRARTRDARRGTRAPGWVVLSVAPVPSGMGRALRGTRPLLCADGMLSFLEDGLCWRPTQCYGAFSRGDRVSCAESGALPGRPAAVLPLPRAGRTRPVLLFAQSPLPMPCGPGAAL